MSSFRRFIIHQQQDAASKPTTIAPGTSATKVLPKVQANSALSPAARQSSRPVLAQKNLNKPVRATNVDHKLSAKSLPRVPQLQKVRPLRQSSGSATRNVLSPKFAGVTKAFQPSKTSPHSTSRRSLASTKAARPVQTNLAPTPAKPKQSHPARGSKSIASPAKKSTVKKKVERVVEPEHPLYTAFREATKAYTTQTTTQLPAVLNTAIENLSTALDAVNLKSQKLIKASYKADLPLTVPLDEEKLIFKDPVTKADINTTLGAKVTAFETIYNTEWKRIRDLWKRYSVVVEQIQGMSIDTSPRAAVIVGNADPKTYAAQHRQLQEEYQRKRGEILQRFEDASPGLVAKVEASEKKYETSRKKQRQSFLQFMQAQMLEDDE